jgi:hypothetical protein
MATPRPTMGGTGTGINTAKHGEDMYEKVVSRADDAVQQTTGVSMFHYLTIGSIATSLGLFMVGSRKAALFVGLWPPTFLALKSLIETKKSEGRL